MTLQQLRYFVMVSECSNITEAAEKLYISQPSLSNAIRNLEKEMNVTAFSRSNKGMTLTREGEELLSYARMLLEQAEIMEDHFGVSENRSPKFSVSCQHYSFAVNAFVEVVKKFNANEFNFILRETQTGEIIDDVAEGLSEIGIIFLSENNQEVLRKMIRKNDLIFEELFVAEPHVFISKEHPLAQKDVVQLDDLKQYPYLVFEQGDRNSFYFSEEFLSVLDFPKTIQVRDRATLFNLVIGLNGFTVSSGVIDSKLNGDGIIARKLDVECKMHIGIVRKKNILFSKYAEFYVGALREYLSIIQSESDKDHDNNDN